MTEIEEAIEDIGDFAIGINQEVSNISLGMAIDALEEIQQYRAIGTAEEITRKLAELERWHTSEINPDIKNVFANMSTQICHNCDHKDEYIAELEAEIEQYREIGTVKECWAAMEKQTPKKPVSKSGISTAFVDYADGTGKAVSSPWQDWCCPVCGWFVGQRYNKNQSKPHDQRKSNYCNECGQKIGWEIKNE